MRVSGLTISVTAAFFTLIALGSWQLQRRAEKLQLMAKYEEAMKSFPEPFPPESLWPSTDFTKMHLRKVTLEGRFLPGPEIHVYRLLPANIGPYHGPGWDIIQPFEIKGGGLVFVNRGFVPHIMKNPLQRPNSGIPLDEQTINGLARGPERANYLTPKENRQRNEWYLRDPALLEKYLGYHEARFAPLIIDQLTANPDGLPQAGTASLQFSNRHLEYALTWYSLAGVLAVIFFIYRRKRKRAAFQPAAG